ncbi:MAG: MFS transporter [Motiliproteus sp.]
MRNLLLLASALAFSQTGVVVYLSFAALTGYWLADDKSMATLPLALQFVGNALVVIPVSILMRKHGRRTGFIIGQSLGAAGATLSVVSVLQHDFWLFCWAAILIGAHNAVWQHYRFAALECVRSSRQSMAVGLVLSGGVVAAFLGGPLADWGELSLSVLYAGGYAVVVGLCLLSLFILCFLHIEAIPESITALELESRTEPSSLKRPAYKVRPLRQIVSTEKFVLAVTVSSFSFAMMAFVMNATPLAMKLCGFEVEASNRVVQLHTLGMFAPSVFTAILIRWQGHFRTMIAGIACFASALVINLSGIEFVHFAVALLLVGLGWNLMFISSTDLLVQTYRESEKEKVQATHDLFMFGVVGGTNYFAGASLMKLGWEGVNLLALVPLTGLLLLLLWRVGKPATVVEQLPAR